MVLAPWCSDAEDILVADGPGVDHQRPRDPLTSTVSRRTRRARNIDASARVHGSIHSHTFRRKERRARSTVMLDAGSVWVAVKDGLDSAVCFSGM